MRFRRTGIDYSVSARRHRNDVKVADGASVGDGEGNLGSATKAVRNTCLGDGDDCSCRYVHWPTVSSKAGKLGNKLWELLTSFCDSKDVARAERVDVGSLRR